MSIGPQAKMGLDDVCPQCCGPLVVGQFLEDDPERWDRFECPLARKRRWVSMTCARKRRGPLVEIEERSYIYTLGWSGFDRWGDESRADDVGFMGFEKWGGF